MDFVQVLGENKVKITLASVLVVGLAALVATGANVPLGMVTADDSIGTDRAGTIVQSALEAQGQQADIVSVTSYSPNLYEIAVEGQDATLSRYYLTKDGDHMTTNPINVTDFTQRARARTQFLSCLRQNNVQIYGQTNNQATLVQIQVLGGLSGLNGIYQNLNQQTLAQLVQSGVQQIPVTVHDGSIYQGAKSVGFYQNITGCTYELGNQSAVQ